MYNHVGNALQNLSGTVEGLGRQVGDNRLASAELGLKTAEQALRIPGMKLQSQQSQDKLDQSNQPVNISTFARPGDPESVLMLLKNFGDQGKPSNAEKLAITMGATIDDKGNFMYGDRPATNRDLNKYAAKLQRVMGIESDPKKALVNRRNMAQKYLDGGTDKTGAPLDDKMRANLTGGIAKIDNMVDADYLRGYEQKLADLEASKAPFIDSGGNVQWINDAISRAQKKIDSYRGKIAKNEERGYRAGLKATEKADAEATLSNKREYDKVVAEQLQEDKLAIAKLKSTTTGKKDTRSTFQKESEFLADVNNISVKEASDIIRADNSIPERLRAYAQDLEPVSKQLEMMDIDIEEYNKQRRKISKRYGLDKPETTGMPRTKNADDWRNYK